MFILKLVRLRGKYLREYFCDLQTLNLWFSLNSAPVAYTGFWHFMPGSLSKYMGILLSPCSIYTIQGFFRHRGILLHNVRIVHCCNLFLCKVLSRVPKTWSQMWRPWALKVPLDVGASTSASEYIAMPFSSVLQQCPSAVPFSCQCTFMTGLLPVYLGPE